MKHKTLQILLAVLMSMAASVVCAEDFEVDGIYYNITSSTNPLTVAVTYRGDSYSAYSNEYSGEVVIPESVTYDETTYSVTSIGYQAFYKCSELTSVVIPYSIESIGYSAFDDCYALASVNIPETVTFIDGAAFSDCRSLTSITLPDGIPSIGSFAFDNCIGLSSITIPESVTSIGSSAFEGCSGLTSVTIPNSVTSIGIYAFRDCSGLTSVTIGNSVTSIGGSAFSGTAWYNNQPDGLVYVGKVAYKYKGIMPENTEIVLEEGTLGIAAYAFSGCTGLTSITIPNSVTSIGSNAFYNCI